MFCLYVIFLFFLGQWIVVRRRRLHFRVETLKSTDRQVSVTSAVLDAHTDIPIVIPNAEKVNPIRKLLIFSDHG